MPRSLRHVGVVFAAALLVAGSSFGAVNAYLKVPGVRGDSTNAMLPGVQGWTQVLSFSWGAERGRGLTGGAAPPQGSGRVTIDTNSPKLMQLCAAGRHFPKLELEVNGRRCVLNNVLVSSVSRPTARNAGGGASPKETIQFTFSAIQWTYAQ